MSFAEFGRIGYGGGSVSAEIGSLILTIDVLGDSLCRVIIIAGCETRGESDGRHGVNYSVHDKLRV